MNKTPPDDKVRKKLTNLKEEKEKTISSFRNNI